MVVYSLRDFKKCCQSPRPKGIMSVHLRTLKVFVDQKHYFLGNKLKPNTEYLNINKTQCS